MHPLRTIASTIQPAVRPNQPHGRRTWFRTCFQPVLLYEGIHRGLLLSLSFATQGRRRPGSEISLTKNIFNSSLCTGVLPAKIRDYCLGSKTKVVIRLISST